MGFFYGSDLCTIIFIDGVLVSLLFLPDKQRASLFQLRPAECAHYPNNSDAREDEEGAPYRPYIPVPSRPKLEHLRPSGGPVNFPNYCSQIYPPNHVSAHLVPHPTNNSPARNHSGAKKKPPQTKSNQTNTTQQ